MYRLLAEFCADGTAGAGPDGLGPAHCGWLTSDDFATANSRGTIRFLALLNNLPKASAAKYDYLTGLIAREEPPAMSKRPRAAMLYKREKMGRIFNPILSRLRGALTVNIADPSLRQQFWVHSKGRNPVRYGLLLQKRQIP